jgi:nucleoside-diphosphate-sugar epimerase
MKTINFNKPILVTGGSGYIASWIIKYLLEKNHTVRFTVRNIDNADKYKHLIDITKNSHGKLKVFEADLLKNGSFENAMKDCELIFHTASPFKISNTNDPQKELIDPALEGTQNVLNSANKTPSIKQIILLNKNNSLTIRFCTGNYSSQCIL